MASNERVLQKGRGIDAKLSRADINKVINPDLSMITREHDTCVVIDWEFSYMSDWTVADPRVTRSSMRHRSATAQSARELHTVGQ